MAREVYFNGRKERDTDYLRTMLFLQTKLKVVCIAVVGLARWGEAGTFCIQTT